MCRLVLRRVEDDGISERGHVRAEHSKQTALFFTSRKKGMTVVRQVQSRFRRHELHELRREF